MKNKVEKVTVITQSDNQLKILFLGSNIQMDLSKTLFDSKVKQGFYQLVDNQVVDK